MASKGPLNTGDFIESPLFVPKSTPVIGHFTGDGDYDVFEVFEGGMAEVYLCAPRVGLRRAYAFKSPKSEQLLNPIVQRAFRRECSIAVRFAGIMGILPVYGIVEHAGRPFLKMQGVLPDEQDVVSLRDVIERRPLSPEIAGYYLHQLTWAMSMAADRLPGLVHGDIKPENILMLLGVPNISDFGLATVQRIVGNEVLRAGLDYACPEAIAGETPTSAWDVYSLGVLLAELLTGQRPGHQTAAGTPDDPVAIRLLAISGLCCSTDPAARPDMRQLHQYIVEAAPGSDWPVPISAMRAYEFPTFTFLSAAVSGGSDVLSSLLRNQDYEGMLEEVDRRDARYRTWRDLLYRGIALSLLGRDEEALVSYSEAEVALGSGDPGQLDRIFLERAASLKRLGRYDAASSILNRLIVHGSDEQTRTTARLNLSALLVDCGQHDQARRVLLQVLANSVGPEGSDLLYTAYINLAGAERDSNPEASVAILRQAVTFRPSDNLARHILADVLLFKLDRAQEAAAVLDGAIGAGSTNLEILRKRLMCAVLTLDVEATMRIINLLRERDGQDDIVGRLIDANMDAAIHCRRFGRPDLELEQGLPADLREAIPSYAESRPDVPLSIWNVAMAAADAEGPDAREDEKSVPQQSGNHGVSTVEWDDRALSPHIRADRAMGFDYYVAFDQPDVVERIVEAYRTVASVLSHQVGTVMTGSPIVLVRCAACSAEVATTRSAGDPLDCCCGAAGEVTPVNDSRLAAVRDRLALQLYPDGEKPLEGWAVIVFVQLPDQLSLPDARRLDRLIERHGLERLDDHHPGAQLAYVKMIGAGQNLSGLPLVALRWYYPGWAVGSSHVTPVPVQAFLAEFRSAFGMLNSASYAYDTTAGDFESLILDGRLDEAEALLASRPVEREDADRWNILAGTATATRDLGAMERYVRAAITADPDNAVAWHYHTALLLRNGQLQDALDAAERACELQPGSDVSWLLLAQCHHQQGDQQGAAEALRRALALGADPDSLPAIFTEVIGFGLLAQGGHANPAEEADSLEGFGLLRSRQGQIEEGRDLPQAQTDTTRDLGPERLQAITAPGDLADAYPKANDIARAIPLLELTLAERQRVFGNDHLMTLWARNNLGAAYLQAEDFDRAVQFLEQLVSDADRLVNTAENPDTLKFMTNLAVAYIETGNLDHAITLFIKIVDERERIFGIHDIGTQNARLNLLNAYARAGSLDKAISLAERTLTEAEQELGVDHLTTLKYRNIAAGTYQAANDYSHSVSLLERNLAFYRQMFGSDHPDTRKSRDDLASMYLGARDWDNAIELMNEKHRDSVANLGRYDSETLKELDNIAIVYRVMGDLDSAVSAYEHSIRDKEHAFGPNDPGTLATCEALACVYLDAGELGLAAPLLDRVITTDNPQTLLARDNLARQYRESGEIEHAISLFQRTRADMTRLAGPNHPDTLAAVFTLAEVYREAGVLSLATALHNQVTALHEQNLRDLERKFGNVHHETIIARFNLASVYYDTGNRERAMGLYEQTLTQAEQALGASHPLTQEIVQILTAINLTCLELGIRSRAW